MKRLLLSLLVLSAGTAPGQEAPSLKHYGAPFATTNCEIAWAAPTNHMPKALWIYKTIPQKFSDKTISNLVALGSFAMSNKLTHPAGTTDKDGLGYVDEDEKRYLVIAQTLGYIDYEDRKADDIHSVIEDVPSEAMTQELGLNLLDQIGIPRSELATKPNSPEPLTFKETGSRGHYDKEQHKTVKEGVHTRGVSFVRQIDGVTFTGGAVGGLHVRFTSHARVARLELVWRNLQPYRKYEVASPGQIIQWIKEGKAVVTIPDEGKVDPSEIKKLTITEITPLYAGELGEKPQELTYPFARLDTIAETGQTNIGVQLYCPILSTNLIHENR